MKGLNKKIMVNVMKNLKGIILLAAILLAGFQITSSQNIGISTTGATPNSNAILDIVSPSTGQGKGLLIPRITYAQRTLSSQAGGLLDGSGNLYGGAAQGLMVYQTDASGDGEGFYFNTSSSSTPNWDYISSKSVSERSNHVLVKSLADFPSPVSGEIILEDNISYEINGTVNIGSNRIIMGVSNTIYGIDKSNDKLVYTGSSNMISGSNQDFTIRTVFIYAPIAGSKVFNVTGSTNKVQLVDNIFGGCKDLGVFDGGEMLVVDRNLIVSCSNGLELKGDLEHVFYVQNVHEENTGSLYTIPSGTFHVIMISGNYFDIDSPSIGLDIAAFSATISDAKIVNNFFVGDGTYINGVSTSYAFWFFFGNTELPDSKPSGELEIHGNTTATSIVTHNTYYKAEGVNYSSSGELFDTNGVSNRLRYTGTKDLKSSYTVSGSLKVAASGNKVKVAVYKNGTERLHWTQLTPTNTSSEYSFSIQGTEELETNDYLEVFVYAQSTRFDITITELNFSIED
ncbi:MAG: hypothetical protein HOG05_14505 [Bacteroidetes bacterium]|jgi:hypothetical protein|nr:hypothetical protein [Bacteroidota bacterium]